MRNCFISHGSEHLSGHGFSYISTSKNSVSYVYLFVVLFCFFQVFLNISTTCMFDPRAKNCIHFEKSFKISNSGCVPFCYLDFLKLT